MAAGTARATMELERAMKSDVQTACAMDSRFRAVKFTRGTAVSEVPTEAVTATNLTPDEESSLVAALYEGDPKWYDSIDATDDTPRQLNFVLRGPTQTHRFLDFVRTLERKG